MNPKSFERRLGLLLALFAGALLGVAALAERPLPSAQAQILSTPSRPTLRPPPFRTPTPTRTRPPRGGSLSVVKFSEPVKTEQPEYGVVYLSTGLYSNTLRQTFVITITGLDPASVITYTREARFYLEAVSTEAQPQPTDKESAGQPDRVRLLRENADNLLIEFDLAMPAEERIKTYPGGYRINFVVDPTVKNGVTHDYWARCLRSSSATVEMAAGEGRVAGWLKRGATLAATRVVSAPSNSGLPTPAPASTALLMHDLAVRGWQTPTPGRTPQSKYQVRGSWLKTYSDSAPAGGATPCP